MILFNIKTKLFLILVLVSIIPIIVVSLSSYRSYTKLVNEQTSLITSTTIGNSVKSMEEILQNIDRISVTLLQQSSNATAYSTVSDELTKLNDTNDQYDIFMIRSKLKLIFENILLGYNYINGLYLFTPDGKWISYGSSGTDLRLDYVALQDQWYLDTIQRKGDLYVGEVGVKPYIINAKQSIGFSRALYDPNNHEFLGVFMLDCGMNIFDGLKRNPAPSLSNLYLADDQGKILYSTESDQIGHPLPASFNPAMKQVNSSSQYKTIQDKMMTVIQKVPGHNWNVIANISLERLYEQYNISQKLFLYVAVSCAVIFLLLSFFLSNLITKPIIELTKMMRKTKSHQFVKIKPQKSKHVDEIGILYHEFNKMMKDIDTHIRESYQNKILTLDSQMKALEAQINSHFLYNTLESINSIAEIEEVESIVIMTKSLGDMFRYSIKTDSERVTVSEELQHVENYMAIQQIRYGDKINFELYVEPEIQNHYMLKLLLQPLVENAIYHGLENKRGKGTIMITGKVQDEQIIFEVCDDGVGIAPEQADELRQLLLQPPEFISVGQRLKQSIGIKNVHSRIVLYYGDGYGLTFHSEVHRGTRITVKIPSL
ncbi:sensor histidine kinase [Paenibacillus cucumis (ex Kampfer et al. 2016)]|uniref:Sensor histidine kinase n=1 Tax=Paenibacillus cucumis (ex Kampfer et al. 2016) TaxID=1776858 RepID=A0ABS7KK45_9BACL|nr:sensor histidine kinase [Paenibacillus cucumis (ex Kampfer et al. 2016)]MBY0204523.1 sensor histidine kinase [Paenibacillus cucumis (ex Kampfer et al. 2016)]